jgi:hypothetical protein
MLNAYSLKRCEVSNNRTFLSVVRKLFEAEISVLQAVRITPFDRVQFSCTIVTISGRFKRCASVVPGLTSDER